MRVADTLGWVRAAAILIYVAGIATIQIMVGQPLRLWWWLTAAPFFLWTIAPIVAPLAWRRSGWYLTLGVSAVAAVSLALYWQALLGSGTSSTAALIFVFLPIYQWCAVALVAGLALLGRRRQPQ